VLGGELLHFGVVGRISSTNGTVQFGASWAVIEQLAALMDGFSPDAVYRRIDPSEAVAR
jgi:hypothetical protein